MSISNSDRTWRFTSTEEDETSRIDDDDETKDQMSIGVEA